MHAVPLLDVVSTILPSPTATSLLQSALWKAPKLQRAWDDWQRSVGSAPEFLKADGSGLKRLLPLLQHNLQKEGIVLSPEVGSILRAARAREELRYASFRRFGGAGIESIQAAGIETLILKGAASAAQYYPHPSIRHCHDIDLLIHKEDQDRIISATIPAGFQHSGPATESGGVRLTHGSGLSIECHTSLFKVPYYPATTEPLWNRSQASEVLSHSCRIPAATDMLAHLCGHAPWNPRRQSMNWIADAYLLLASGEFPWPPFLSTIHEWQIDLPAYAILRYLTKVLHSPIPESALAELRNAAARTDGLRKHAAIQGVRSSGNRLSELFRSASWPSRCALLRFKFLERSAGALRTRKSLPGSAG